MRLLSFLLGISFLSVMTSCDPASKYAAEIEEIDSCLAVLDSVEEKYNGIEFDSLEYMVQKVIGNEDSIRKYYNPDTLSLQVGIRMNECKGIRKTLKGSDAKRISYKNEIDALRQQFENLKSDIENGVLQEDKIAQYIDDEKKALDVLNLTVTEFYKLQELEKRYFYQSVPFVDSLIVEWSNVAQTE